MDPPAAHPREIEGRLGGSSLGTTATGGISHEDVATVHEDGIEVLTAGRPKRRW